MPMNLVEWPLIKFKSSFDHQITVIVYPLNEIVKTIMTYYFPFYGVLMPMSLVLMAITKIDYNQILIDVY